MILSTIKLCLLPVARWAEVSAAGGGNSEPEAQ